MCIRDRLVALRSTMGKKKVSVAKERIMDINQDAIVHTYDTFFYADTAPVSYTHLYHVPVSAGL